MMLRYDEHWGYGGGGDSDYYFADSAGGGYGEAVGSEYDLCEEADLDDLMWVWTEGWYDDAAL